MTETNKRGKSEAQIRQRLLQAIFEQRMPPGARLTEGVLAETFDVSRTIIRQVIVRLAQEGILVKRPSGATHVASPTRNEVRQILSVRRMIEPEIVKELAAGGAQLSFDSLFAHLAQEDRARQAGERGALVRLTGEFHLHLVELTANHTLIRLTTELQALTCLAILLYASEDEACPADEHRQIANAIVAGNGAAAASLMLRHLKHIEADLNLEDRRPVVRMSETLTWLSGKATKTP